MSTPDSNLVKVFRGLMQMREDMRADGASEAECHAAVERGLRAAMTDVPESEWPHWFRAPRCIKCDGYGLIIRTVVNKLRLTVNEGTPCTCQAGVRFLPKSAAEQDFTAAGKVAPKPKGFSRWNG